jgi:hypothetical protein
MRIVLARHGRPAVVSPRRIAPSQVGRWIDAYNRAGIDAEDIPPNTIAAALASGIVVASSSPRSIQSAQRLSGGRTFLTEEAFCEAGLPYAIWHRPVLPVSVWAACFRVAWFCGYSRNAEPVEHVRTRADAAASRLIRLAADYGSVFLVGHGIMTRLIAKRLRRLGWIGPLLPAYDYWRFNVYRK